VLPRTHAPGPGRGSNGPSLYLFPTKALGQDQVAELGELSRAAGLHINASTYDGDTPNPIRSSIRSAGQVVVTNPDMLHAAILPHHTKWFQLFEQLRIIVIDELHTYRGLFGSHVANVLRGCCASAPTTARTR
jgi:DEAD/DEAH box helicase domain-containing protein